MDDSRGGGNFRMRADAAKRVAESESLQEQLRAALQGEAAGIYAVGALKARIFDMAQQQVRDYERIAAREDALAEAAARIEQLERRLEAAECAAVSHKEQVAALTAALLTLQEEHTATRKEASRVPGLQKQLRALEATIGALHTSTSWRVTKPLRKVKTALTRLVRR